jgi:hypothetical protein
MLRNSSHASEPFLVRALSALAHAMQSEDAEEDFARPDFAKTGFAKPVFANQKSLNQASS